MKTLTPQSRARLAALAAVPLLLLTGCGGDDSSDDTGAGDGSGSSSDNGSDSGSGDTGAGDVPALQGESCDSDVTLSGALTAEWTGEATVDAVGDSDVQPPATYQSNHDDYMLTVSAVGNGFDDETVTLLADGRSFAVPFGEGSVDVKADGSGATIDAEAPEVGQDEAVQIKATFTC